MVPKQSALQQCIVKFRAKAKEFREVFGDEGRARTLEWAARKVEQALREIEGVDNAFVTNVPGVQGDRVGAVVVCNTAATTAERLRQRARRLLSSFKVPTMWLLVDSDDTIPRGPTGKVDARRLRSLLASPPPEESPHEATQM